MILTPKSLEAYAESMRITLTKPQRQAVLERFGTEPEEYEWTDFDISIQIKNFLEIGNFVK